MYFIIQKLLNEKLHFLLNDYNITLKPVLGPMKPERITIIIKRVPPIEIIDYDTEKVGGKRKRNLYRTRRFKTKKRQKKNLSNYII